MTIWIGCDDLDSLLTYPDACYLSGSAQPIRKCATYPDARYLSGCTFVAMLQTSSNHAVFQGGLALIVTNVVNPSLKSAFSGVFARRLTTFVTCGVGDALKMLQIDDVCNNIRVRRPCQGFL